MHCDWFILLLLLPTPTIWFSLDRKGRSRKCSQRKMETFNSHWFFRVLFRRVYDYDFHNVISALKTPLAVPTPCSRLNLIVTASCPLTYLFNLWTIISKSFILCVFLKALLIVFNSAGDFFWPHATTYILLDGKPFYLILWWNLVDVKPLFQYMEPISMNLSNIVIMLLFLYFPYDSFFFFVLTLLKARLIPDT